MGVARVLFWESVQQGSEYGGLLLGGYLFMETAKYSQGAQYPFIKEYALNEDTKDSKFDLRQIP